MNEACAVPENRQENFWQSRFFVASTLTFQTLALHFAFNSDYGYFRDELYFIACGEHLAFGYADHAPLVAFAAKLSRVLFGDSLFAIRLFPALAGAAKVFLTGLLARELGGKRFAVFLACLCVLCAPIYLAMDNYLSMNSFEPLFWSGCAYCAILAVKRNDSRWWLGFGALAGIGLMNKHSMLIFGIAFIIGILLTRERKIFLNRWIWMAGAIAFLIFLPNLIWQYENNWATLELLQEVQKSGKNVVLSPLEFLWQQVFILLPTTAPVWIAGVWYFFADKNGKKFRFLGVCYTVVLALMIYLKAKNYYLAPIYPMLFAAGAVWWEQFFEAKNKRLKGKTNREEAASARFNLYPYLAPLRYGLPVLIIISGLFISPFVLPVLSVENFIAYQEMTGIKPPKTETGFDSVLPQNYADEFGWAEMTEKVSEVYHSLPAEEQAKTAIYASNYGQAGAIDFFGAKYNLPKAISPHQSYFLWGPRDYTGETMILLGWKREEAEKYFVSVEEKTEVNHPYSMSYERYKILLCRGIKKPLPEIWSSLRFWN